MALIKCRECGHDVSTKAEKCPQCGVKVKKKGLGCGGLIVLILLLMIMITALGENKRSKGSSQSTSKPAVETREDLLSKAFHPWDGSHIQLEKFIKKSMNDPDSYEHVETVYWDKGDHLIVKTTFRGKNAFGGKVLNWVTAKAKINGNVVEIIEQGP